MLQSEEEKREEDRREEVRRGKRDTTYSSCQHVIGEGSQTPPVNTLSMACLLQNLRSPVMGEREREK